MDLHLLAVGRLRPGLREVCDDYRRRLGRFARVAEREVREGPGPGGARLEREAEALLRGLADRATLVALDRGGQGWTSEELAARMDRWREAAHPVAFAIGGADGLAPALLARSAARWSLGPLTLPHELARVLAYEQLYRAFTILEGHPYHRA